MRCLLVAVWLGAAAATVHAQDTGFSGSPASSGREAVALNTARELYASARYEEALSVLNSLNTGQPAERRMIEQYRSLCLLALGRAEEAESAIAAVVTSDPFYLPGEAETSPRVRMTFASVRERLLPEIARSRYTAAKATYDRKEHAEAERQFRELVLLIDDPQMQGRLADLRVLASGFVELAAAAAAPPPPPKTEEPAAAPVPAPASPPVPKGPMVYSSDEPGIVLPTVIRQDIPAVPAAITASVKERGVLEIQIDEQGRVTYLALRMRVHPVYDTLLLNAAKEWRYRPATLNGKPVKFRKLLQVSVSKR